MSTPEFSRRLFVGGAATAAVAAAAVAAESLGASARATDAASTDTRYPYEGAHQSGILTAQQASSAFLAFDVVATTAAELKSMFQALTTTSRWLTAGGPAPDHGMTATATDNGVLGDDVSADGLTITVSVGPGLFDDRFGLHARKPARLTRMPEFDDDALDRAMCDGDLMLQVCADHPDTVNRALRILLRATRGALAIRWRMDGFLSPSRPDGAPRNLMGFKDGTANSSIAGHEDDLVWTHGGGAEPAWVEGGSYHVVRLIRMNVEFWDRVSVREQSTLIGRERSSGAPLTGSRETDEPAFTGPGADAIAGNAHIRLASNSGRSSSDGSRLLRRGYNYDAGFLPNGNLDMGLIFVTYNQDLERQFATVQRRLSGEPLTDYVSSYGGGYFFVLPGVRGSDDWLGRAMFA
ncbi:Dyp-type peroxidase [Nocardioides sp. Kera G14]|uniref:Dyp-type peroxidase n=1 Tax=Nocardioides sp. Kera G14 TaxID=2884264 RepID=UPI001D0FA182|nr:Dyp-type peroxidase [Nocardioides sp. Kera G14]UDY22618.1 Dyp-type peroxidase [Nocardioides sp. Kera G14]